MRKKAARLQHGTVDSVTGTQFIVIPDDSNGERIICSNNAHCHLESGDGAPRLSFIRRTIGTAVTKTTRVVFRRYPPDPFARPDQDEVYADWAFESEYDAFVRVAAIGQSADPQLTLIP